MAYVVAVAALSVLQWLAEHPEVTLAIADEVALLRQRLQARPAWASGPRLDLETVRASATAQQTCTHVGIPPKKTETALTHSVAAAAM